MTILDTSIPLSLWKHAWIRFKKRRSALFGVAVITFLILMAIIAPWLTQQTYFETDLAIKNSAPSLQHWFGTDDLGRDVFTRVWYGARISLFVGISAALMDLIIGTIWGGTAAFFGGHVEEIMMRFADILYSLPYLLLVILFIMIMGSGLFTILVAITLTGWITMARIVRGQILQLKQQDYVLASIALGAGFYRILFKHLLPNTMGPIIVTLTLTIPTAIFAEAFLSFMGLGVQAPIASWGTMANDGLPALTFYPWRLFFPAFFISLTMFGFHLIGEGLRDALDVKTSS